MRRGGIADALKGQVPLGLVVLQAGAARPPAEIGREVMALVCQRAGAIASLKVVLVVERLPKARSGKILRATMRAIADSEDYPMPATIDDVASSAKLPTRSAKQATRRRGSAWLARCRRAPYQLSIASLSSPPVPASASAGRGRPRLARAIAWSSSSSVHSPRPTG